MKNQKIISEAVVLPLSDLVIFPGANATIFLDEVGMQALELANGASLDVITILKKTQNQRLTLSRQLHEVGTLVRVIKTSAPNSDGQTRVFVEGLARVHLRRLVQTRPFLIGEIENLPAELRVDPEDQIIAAELRDLFLEYLKLASPLFPREIALEIENEEDAHKIVDSVAMYSQLDLQDQQEILSQEMLPNRLKVAYGIIDKKMKVEQIRKGIKEKLGQKLSEQEKNYVLREEMKVIQKELKKSDKKTADADPEIIELRKKIKEKKLPEMVAKTAEVQLDRLGKQHPSSPDYAMQRDYIDWLLDFPWEKSSPDKINLKKAQKILDERHFGLGEVKERILEFLAVRKLAGQTGGTGAILCFSGPPGVGKTSLGRSIATALNREFVHFSLGGMRDEAEIRGHRRTYIGAMPGRIVQRLKRVGVNNPVFMLDEIDKIGQDFRGDPASALLEVLDPEQNQEFNDHYLDLPIDLSGCFFITTANELDPIPAPLRDRMEIVRFSGYTEQEKLEIAKRHLIPKALRQHGLLRRRVKISESAILEIIRHHTAEAGLRSLERQIQKICRKVAKDIVTTKKTGVIVAPRNLTKYLGPPQLLHEKSYSAERPGIATGLAWTPVGGEIIVIEAVKIAGKGQLKLTGQLGNVMKESVSAAFSYLKSNAAQFGLDTKIFAKNDVHVHIPAGAIPKDGPSAGLALFTTLLSLFKNQIVPEHIAMTGEISLTGRAMKIGGLKEKVLGALRAGTTTIIIPEENRHDLEKISDKIKKKIEFHFVERAEQVAEIVFGKKIFAKKS